MTPCNECCVGMNKVITSRWTLAVSHLLAVALWGTVISVLRWTILVFFSTSDVSGRRSYLHPDFPIVTRRSEHTWICGIPRDCAAASLLMAFQLLNQLIILFVPDIDIALC